MEANKERSMNLQTIFTHMEPNAVLKEKIETLAKRFQRFFQRNFEVKWTCSVEKQGHLSHVIVAGDGMIFNATSTQDNLYKTLDDVTSKLEKQIKKKKTQRTNHIHHGPSLSTLIRSEA